MVVSVYIVISTIRGGLTNTESTDSGKKWVITKELSDCGNLVGAGRMPQSLSSPAMTVVIFTGYKLGNFRLG